MARLASAMITPHPPLHPASCQVDDARPPWTSRNKVSGSPRRSRSMARVADGTPQSSRIIPLRAHKARNPGLQADQEQQMALV